MISKCFLPFNTAEFCKTAFVIQTTDNAKWSLFFLISALSYKQGRPRWKQEGQLPLCLLPWGAGGARIAFHAQIFPSLLSCEGAFSGVETNIPNIVLLEKTLKTNI